MNDTILYQGRHIRPNEIISGIGMSSDQEFCLRWNNHGKTLVSVFENLLENESLTDVTLAAEGKTIGAHRVVLCACSSYFESILLQCGEKHPVIVLKDVRFLELKALLNYMYRGEVNISQDTLPALIRTAENLQIRGLADSGAVKASRSETPPPPQKQHEQAQPQHTQHNQQQQQRERTPSPHSPQKRHKHRRTSTSSIESEDDDPIDHVSSPIDATMGEPLNLNVEKVAPHATNNIENKDNLEDVVKWMKSDQWNKSEQWMKSEPWMKSEQWMKTEPPSTDEEASSGGNGPRGGSTTDMGLGSDFHHSSPQPPPRSSEGERFVSSWASSSAISPEETLSMVQNSPQMSLGRENGGPSAARKVFACSLCGRSYSNYSNMMRHRRFDCGTEPQFHCDSCGKRFKYRFRLTQHMIVHHKYSPASLLS